ncbi:YggS family pyridoxal phosphate enzyme [Fibrobacter sp. UWB1]|uniref:YggS family pyridoxal phosphate-dependent enzyme n=1 Tax=Fibrobacter sp. UWB1 TaxID=1964355 RepID=UPI000B525772|nr:YggS family pyridoxal phosphate-dependent enzyme [Fibrobacter sp. UWB1]OWV24873.1 YggS family pyridoxal phosphate enzyme [Fibrobacter sp. UWB1]
MEFTLEEMREHLAALEARIAEACKIAGRSRDSVKLVWVSKFHPAEAVENAIALGATDFGENRVQEAELKFSEPRIAKDGNRVRCHVIGPVQSNKLKKAAIVADCIHSIASIEAVEKLERVCAALPGENGAGKILDILFQVNAGEEETKSGLDVHEAEAFLADLENRAGAATADGKSENFPHLRFRGLMTIGKNTGVAEDSRECFAFLRNLQQKFLAKGGVFANFDQLSMGMTGDLEVAIEEGSTMIRVGTALFGERDYSKPVNDPV